MYSFIHLDVASQRMIVRYSREIGQELHPDHALLYHSTQDYLRRLTEDAGCSIPKHDGMELLRLAIAHPYQLETKALREKTLIFVEVPAITIHESLLKKTPEVANLPTSGYLAGLVEIYLSHLDGNWEKDSRRWV